MASIGEAIALQGRLGMAERLGAMEYKAAQASGNRLAKLAYQQAAQKQKEDKAVDGQFAKLFSQKDKFHKLVEPLVNKTLESAYLGYKKAKTSGDPYASNTYEEIMFNTSQEIRKLRTLSDNYFQFQKQAVAGEKGNIFINPKDKAFVDIFSKATDVNDLKSKLETSQLQPSEDLRVDENGFITYAPQKKINYVRDLSSRMQVLKPIPVDETQKPLPFNKIELRKFSAIPYKAEDAQKLYDSNPSAFPSGVPQSIEDVVNVYVRDNLDVVEQFAADAKMQLRTDSNGVFLPEDLQQVKERMLENMKQYAQQDQKYKVIGETPKFGPEPEARTSGIVEEFEETWTVRPSANNPNPKPKIVKGKGSLYVGIPYGNVKESKDIFNESNRPVTGNLNNATLNTLKIYPIKREGGYRRIAFDGEKNEGYDLFYELDVNGQRYWIPYDKVAFSQKKQGSKADWVALKPDIDKLVIKSRLLNKNKK
jgi:hypothetical protein